VEEKPKAEGISKAEEKWSKSLGGLTGRLIVKKPVIGVSETLGVILELKNVGGRPLDFTVDKLQAEFVDANGTVVKPTWGIGDENVPEFEFQRKILPQGSYVGVRVSRRWGAEYVRIGSEVWKLSPGKYQLGGRYWVDWPRAFELPPVEIEVMEDEKAPVEAQASGESESALDLGERSEIGDITESRELRPTLPRIKIGGSIKFEYVFRDFGDSE